MATTLSHYYNQYAKEQGYNSWNHLCAAIPPEQRDALKKVLKKYFNEKLKNKERQQAWRDKQKELKNVRQK